MTQDSTQPAPLDFTPRTSFTYAIGMYLAVNAIRDAYLLIDSPDCANSKILYIQGNHDLCATLSSVTGYHRIANTDLHPEDVAASRESAIHDALVRMADFSGSGLVLISSMPMATLIGMDYDRIARQVSRETGKPVAGIPGRSLSGDWLDGYAQSLLALARHMDLSGADPHPDRTAVVGYLMDRNEGDHRANLKELGELLRGIGLSPVSIWLDGGDYEGLREVRRAGSIISLPYGERAAQVLAQRLNIPLIRTELPLGLDNTQKWLTRIAEGTGRPEKAPAVIESALERILPGMEWMVPFSLLDRNMIFMGDPHLYRGVLSMARELGIRVVLAVLTGGTDDGEGEGPHPPEGPPVLIDPHMDQLHDAVRDLTGKSPVHLVLGCSSALHICGNRAPFLEIGYPSFFSHALFERPFLGFSGTAAVIERMANRIRLAEAGPGDLGSEKHGPMDHESGRRGG